MQRFGIVIAAVLPACAVAAVLIGMAAWRDREAAAEARARDELATRQLDEMKSLGAKLTTARDEAKTWRERWETDTKRLGDELAGANDELAKANQALIDSLGEQKKAQTAIAELTKQLADLAERLKALEKAK